MDSVARLSAAERAILFQETANRRGLAPLIIEKDFWVCWTLKHLFELPLGQHLIFKGGTSLSKIFHVIKRFSEDIDLSISRESLGFGAAGVYPITPYAAEEFPDYFEAPTCQVKTLAAERTFWEKATILHAEFFRPDTSSAGERISRHYYDLYQMTNSPIAEKALMNFDLLKRVVEHKRIFFRSAWARYEEACPGSLRLVPPQEKQSLLRADYDKMKEFFFETEPSFQQMLNALRELEKKINDQNE